MEQLRISQGLYAPLKFKMERETAAKIGRLPCLRSSNLMLSVLRGTDETIEIEDILNSKILQFKTEQHKMIIIIPSFF